MALTTAALAAASASAASLSAHGQLLQLREHANQSSNWFGYGQGTLEQGSKLFNSISGDWTVPAATQHTRGRQRHRRIGSGSAAVASTRAAR
jgi:hypothetical protein